MQEIKFRVWDGNRICGVKNIEFAEDGIIIAKDDGYFGYLGSDFELLQYTGTKDRHGKEIYSGYIAKDGITRNGKERTLVSFWDQSDYGGSWWFKESGKFAKNIRFEKLEIIGNIYENPELVEDKT